MDHNPESPKWNDRDRFVLSNGHICPVLYAVLARSGYFPVSELMTLRKKGTRLHGHPHHLELPGLDNSAGPLGEGISIACGMAYGAKMDHKKYTVYCSMGDGEINEGQPWEAFMFAAKNKLDNLIVFIDRNFIQIDGDTEKVMPLEPLADKMRAFGHHVIEVDGNDMASVLSAFTEAKSLKGKPICILTRTVPGKGVSFMEGKASWHGMPPNKDQAEQALNELLEQETRIKG
jgi:transketolase